MTPGGVCGPALQPSIAWEGLHPANGVQGRGQNRTREIRLSGIVGGLMETWVMGVGLRPGGKPPESPPTPNAVARHDSIPTSARPV